MSSDGVTIDIVRTSMENPDIKISYIAFRNASEKYANDLYVLFKSQDNHYTLDAIRDGILMEMHGIVMRNVKLVFNKEGI